MPAQMARKRSPKAPIPKEVRELFARWGSEGGKARKRRLSAERRREIARRGGEARQAQRKRK
jgi:hypothetical protein